MIVLILHKYDLAFWAQYVKSLTLFFNIDFSIIKVERSNSEMSDLEESNQNISNGTMPIHYLKE